MDLSYRQVLLALPKKKRGLFNQEMYDLITNQDDFDSDVFIDKVISLSVVLGNKRFNNVSFKQYVDAVKFSSFLAHEKPTQAYRMTFPDRQYKTESTLLSRATQYNRTELVTQIKLQSQISDDLLYMGDRHKAFGVLLEVMDDPDASDKSKVDAADKFLTHSAKVQDKSDIQIEIDVKNSALDELNNRFKSIGEHLDKQMETGEITLAEVIEGEPNGE